MLSKCYCNDIITWGILLKINYPNPSCSNSFLPEHTAVLNSSNTQVVEPLSGGRGQWPFLPGRDPLSGLSCFSYPLKASWEFQFSRKHSKGNFFSSFQTHEDEKANKKHIYLKIEHNLLWVNFQTPNVSSPQTLLLYLTSPPRLKRILRTKVYFFVWKKISINY